MPHINVIIYVNIKKPLSPEDEHDLKIRLAKEFEPPRSVTVDDIEIEYHY